MIDNDDDLDEFLSSDPIKVGDIVTGTELSIKNGWGTQANPEIGKCYKVTKVVVHSYSTDVYVEGEKQPFNSVKLEKVE